jgi:hypothetical protein
VGSTCVYASRGAQSVQAKRKPIQVLVFHLYKGFTLELHGNPANHEIGIDGQQAKGIYTPREVH